MSIPDNQIQQVKQTADILEVVEMFIPLKKRGTGYTACCPFHDEKTPSFHVTPSLGIYKCFGCGKGGDSISFVMEQESISYPEAIRFLASRYNIEIEEREQTIEEKQKISDNEKLHVALNYAQQFFVKNLHKTEEGKSIGLSYFKQRKFTDEVLRTFELGYSLDSWDGLLESSRKVGLANDILMKAGLVIQNDSGKIYDRFRARIMFPIHNVGGKVIGFGARTLKNSDGAKYLNSPETDVYTKNQSLYGLFQAKKSLVQKDLCYLVEGYTDVIAMHMAGITNVVASSGTSLTDGQIRLIARFTKNIVVLYDGDTAGIKASMRGIDLILAQGLNVQVVSFPTGEDPDSYSQKLGKSDFQAYLQNKKEDFLLFKTKVLTEGSESNPTVRAEAIRDIVGSISKIPDPIKRAVFFKACAKALDINETVLISEGGKLIPSDVKKSHPKQRTKELPPIDLFINDEAPQAIIYDPYIDIKEEEIISTLLKFGGVQLDEGVKMCEYLFNELADVNIENEVYKEIFNECKKMHLKGENIDPTFFTQHENEKIKSTAINLLVPKYQVSESWESKGVFIPKDNEFIPHLVQKLVLDLKKANINKLIAENLEHLNSSTTTEREDALIRRHLKLKSLI